MSVPRKQRLLSCRCEAQDVAGPVAVSTVTSSKQQARVAATPTRADTPWDHGGTSGSIRPKTRLPSPLPCLAVARAQASLESRCPPAAVELTRASNAGHPARPLRRRAAMPSRCKSCCGTQLDGVTVELEAGESQLEPLGEAACHEDAAQVCKKMAAERIARPGTSARRANLHSPFGDHYSLLNDQGRALGHAW
jgi:hypothetical protein